MIRASILLPAFVIAFGLAGASLAMADGSTSNNATQGHAKAKAAETASSCGSAPRYLEPDYCQSHNHK
jgi:hypothetical protein